MALIPDGLYNIVSSQNASITDLLYMDLYEGQSGAGVPIQSNYSTGGDNQKWWVTYFPDQSAYAIMNAMTGTFASGVQTNSPDPIHSTIQSDVNPYYCVLRAGHVPTDPPSYTIEPVVENDYEVFYLADYGLGPKIILYTWVYDPYVLNQEWQFLPLGDDGTLGDQD